MKKNLVYHPYLFAIYPILFLFAYNIGQVRVTEIIKPLVIVLFVTSILFALLKILLKDVHKAGLEASLLLFLTFAYGQVNNLLTEAGIISNDPRPLLALWSIFFILGVWGIWRLLKRADAVSRFLNVVSPILLIFPIFQIIQFVIVEPITVPPNENFGVSLDIEGHLSESTYQPDIYYIVLDAYARGDVLSEVYDFDNSEFLNFLTKNGFYIAEESFTNYIQTSLALSASLNMVYMDSFAELMGIESENRSAMASLIQDSTLRDALEGTGYITVAIISGYDLTEIKDADVYYTSRASETDQFDDLLLLTTPALVFKDDILFKARRDRLMFGIESLREIPIIEGPKFVFAHLMIPHPPFVYGPSGEEIRPRWVFNRKDGNYYEGTPEEYIAGYRKQLTYTNQLLRDVITDILSKSNETPIIILQGDHGPGALLNWELVERNNCLKERAAIFNAILMPEKADRLYPTISPVNTFRVLLDAYFGTDVGTIEDKTYYSSWWTPYDFIDVSAVERHQCVQ